MSPTRRVLALLLGIMALVITGVVAPLDTLVDAIASVGPAAPMVGVLVGALLLVALMPRTPVSLACGLLFGAGLGIVCALLIALVAAAVTFAAGRWLGREFVARHAGRRWRRLEGWIAREGVLAVATVRALPLGPYGLSGYAYGASGISTRHYAVGTLMSAAPSAVSYALLGAAVSSPGEFNPLTVVPLAFGLALSAALVVRARRQRRHDGGYGGGGGDSGGGGGGRADPVVVVGSPP